MEGELPSVVVAGEELLEFEERWTGAYIFENEWQSFRTRKDRDLELTSAAHTNTKPGRYILAVKVIDIFGNDTMTLLPVNVGWRHAAPPHPSPCSRTGVTSTERSPSATHTVPSCTVTCRRMERWASPARAWLWSAGTCQTERLRARVILVAMVFHQTGVLAPKL